MTLPLSSFSQEYQNEQYELIANGLGQSGATLSNEGKHTEALDSFLLFLDYRKKIYGNENYYLASPYMYIGISYKNLGENDKALEYYKLSEKNILLRSPLNLRLLGNLYLNIGNVYRAKLDYSSAIKYFKEALTNFQSQKPIEPFKIVDAYYAIAEIHFLSNNYQEVINIAEECYNEADTANQIFFDNILGGSYYNLKEFKNADNHYKHAIDLSMRYYGTSLDLAYAYMSYAEFLSETIEFEDAVENLSHAYATLEATQQNQGVELANYYEYEGNIYRNRAINTKAINQFKTEKKQNLVQAIGSYKKGLAALGITNTSPESSELFINQIPSLMDCISLIKAIGDVYLEMALLDNEDRGTDFSNNLELALGAYNNTSSLIQKARKELSNDDSKIQLTDLQYETISKIIETAHLAYNNSQNIDYLNIAFSNAEQLKSSAMFDKIANNLAQENSLIPDSILEHERRLNNTIAIYSELEFNESTAANPDRSVINEYNTKVFNASRERDELNRFMEENYPDYYELKYSNKTLGLADIQNQIDKNQALIEYVLIEPSDAKNNNKSETDSLTSLYSFFITSNQIKFTKNELAISEKIALEETFRFMASKDYMFTQTNDAKNFCISSHCLYELLIQPFEQELEDKNLTIIPDGKLNYISFDGLLRTLPDTTELIRFDQLDYFVRHNNINYANSVNIFLKNTSSKPKLKVHTLAFAPEYKSEVFEMTGTRYTLSPLPGVQKEVDAISKSVNTVIFRNKEATEDNFRKESSQYDILHLAMHAYINDSLPAYSRLAFDQNVDSTVLSNDGWLNTADIYNLNLNARMTVLSACNTGVGRLQKGEGLMSLARGFLYAGCPSVVMSMWEVEDEAGTKIMTSFYKYLKGGKTKDEALRLAKLKYLEDSNSRLAHPHYWMSFKSIGENSPVYTSYDIYFFALLIVLIIAFSVDQGLRIKKARRNRQA
ncbi:MAG TPA: CHAT domain-containing tetratricopeptide repeat protein [Draconibacterium sp.]|nr:CHAT domain-containing tetratricopeptide repeat protein [Draconibacterium sp.]